MKKSFLIIILTLFLFSVLVNFERSTLDKLISSSVLFWFFLVGCVIIMKHFFASVQQHRRIKAIVFLFVFMAFLFVNFVFIVQSISCSDIFTTNHFATNSFTNECVYGGASSCGSDSFPWFYKDGCDDSQSKIEALKKAGYYDNVVESCNQLCEYGKINLYCRNEEQITSNTLLGDISCPELFTCDSISCER